MQKVALPNGDCVDDLRTFQAVKVKTISEATVLGILGGCGSLGNCTKNT